jgi:hypothetical protein
MYIIDAEILSQEERLNKASARLTRARLRAAVARRVENPFLDAATRRVRRGGGWFIEKPAAVASAPASETTSGACNDPRCPRCYGAGYYGLDGDTVICWAARSPFSNITKEEEDIEYSPEVHAAQNEVFKAMLVLDLLREEKKRQSR